MITRLGASVRPASGYLRKWLILGVASASSPGSAPWSSTSRSTTRPSSCSATSAATTCPPPPATAATRVRPDFARPWAIPLVTCAAARWCRRHRRQAGPRGRGPRHRQRHRGGAHRPAGDPCPGGARQDGGQRADDRLGRFGRPRGPDRADLRRIRLAVDQMAGSVRRGRPHRGGAGHRSGIGAIFGAPLGGAVLAASIVYREDFDYRSLIPGFITSATAYAVYGSILGFEPLFGYVAPDYRSTPAAVWRGSWSSESSRRQSVTYTPGSFYGTVALTPRLPGRQGAQARHRRAAGRPDGVASSRRSSSQRLRLGAAGDRPRHPRWRSRCGSCCCCRSAKIVATSLSIGTGGSGGIFGPGIVIGAFVGAAIWRIADLTGLARNPRRPRRVRHRRR